MTITRTQDGFIIKNNAEKLAKIYEGYYKSNSNTFKNYEKIECIAMSGNVILDEKELAALPIGKAVSVAEADLSNAAKTPSAKPPKTPGKSL